MQELNMKDSLDANLVQMSTNYCLVYVAFSTALFYRLSTHFLPMYIPFSVVEKNKQWMFKNICNSFLHSSISSVWIAFCLWNYPAHRYDLINVYSNQSYLLICFSVGYFLYDFLDMYWNDRDNSLHLLVHHVVVMGVFGVALYSRFYLGYAMVGLLVEVNSVFLHVRTLMRLSARAATYPRLYQAVCILNFGTFIVFRLYLLAYLTLWLLQHRAYLNPSLFLFTLPCLATINAMSWLLFAKIAVEDFAARLIVAGRLLRWGRLVRHLEAQVALADRRRCSEDQNKGESTHFLDKDPYCSKEGNIPTEEELCFTKRGDSSLPNNGENKSFKNESRLVYRDKGLCIPSHRLHHGAETAERVVVGESLERNLASSKSESKICDKESEKSRASDEKRKKESNVDSVSNHSGRDNEKDVNISSTDENVTRNLNNDRHNKTSDKEFTEDLKPMGGGSNSSLTKSGGNCDRLQFASDLELTKRPVETNLSHRVCTGESLPRTSCSEFLESERVCQSKVKAS